MSTGSPALDRMIARARARDALSIAVTEKQFLEAVVDLAHLQGWLVHHVLEQRHYARRIGPGFPDLVMVRGARVVFAELKVGKNRLTEDQRRWAVRLGGAANVINVRCHIDPEVGVSYHEWRPEDWDKIADCLGRRR